MVLKNKSEKKMRKILKRTLQTALLLTTLYGTYSARDGDFPPIYSNKTGDSYGINVSLYTRINEGATINGANMSIVTQNLGTINGVNLNLVQAGTYSASAENKLKGNLGDINGLDISILASLEMKQVNGVQLSVFFNNTNYVNGFQAALFPETNNLSGTQVGIYNHAQNDGVILNFGLSDNHLENKK